jgi:hypothetical protein
LEKVGGEGMMDRIKELEREIRKLIDKPKKMQKIMRKHKFVIDNLEDRWQKLAFTFYTEIVETDCRLKKLVEEK